MRTIDADAALKALRKCQTYLYDARDPELKIELSSAEAAINNLPTIQPVATDTNVGDKISRQQAIELIKNYCENGCDIAEDNWCPSCQREQFMKLLKALPTVPPEPQWIPVSERLPEKGGEYLVSVHHTIGAISVFHPEKDTYVDDVAIMKYYGKFPSTVRAWMPMPEAYKEGGEKI